MRTLSFKQFTRLQPRRLSDLSEQDRIESLLDGQEFIFFFKKGEEVFATEEDGRITFATLKNGEDGLAKGWDEDTTFMAQNLTRAVQGEPITCVFGKKDLKKIKVIDKDEARKQLTRQIEKGSPKAAIQLIHIKRG